MPKSSRSASRSSKSSKNAAKVTRSLPVSSAESVVSPSQKMSFGQLVMMVAAFVIVNAVVLYAANILAPNQIVLGNHLVSPSVGVVMVSVVLSFVIVGSLPLLESVVDLFKLKLKDSHMILFYFVVNTLAVWLLSRFAEMLGFGISSWVVAICLGFVLNLVQGVVIKSLTATMAKA